MSTEQKDDTFDMDNLDALDAVEGVVVEGGFDPETAEDDGCAGGACKSKSKTNRSVKTERFILNT